MSELALGAGCAIAMFILMKALAPLAARLGLVDHPDGVRKRHDGIVPLTGGPALLLVLVSATAIAPASLLAPPIWLLLVAAATVVLGAIDDRQDLRPTPRLVAQLALATALVLMTDRAIVHVGDLFGTGERIELGALAPFVTIFAIAAAMNAFNMLDGTDGQASGLGLVTAATLLAGSSIAGAPPPLVLVVLCATLPVFLGFNLIGAGHFLPKSFLGDSGALVLGLFIGAGLIDAAFAADAWLDPIHALWFAALPIFDTFFVMTYRILHGRSPLSADRNHIHHLLRDHGLRKEAALGVVLGLAALIGVLGLLQMAGGVATAASFFALLVLFVVYCMTALALHRHRPAGTRDAPPATV